MASKNKMFSSIPIIFIHFTSIISVISARCYENSNSKVATLTFLILLVLAILDVAFNSDKLHLSFKFLI